MSVPNGPFGFAATNPTATSLKLSWYDNSNDETGFRVERQSGAAGAPSTLVTTLGVNATGYTDTGLSAGTTYAYRVQAFNASGGSGYATGSGTTTGVVVTPPATGSVPNAPFALAVRATGPTSAALSWYDNSDNETNFVVERKVAGGAYAVVATLAANTVAYTDSGLAPSTAYTYRVKAVNGSLASGYCLEAGTTTQTGTGTDGGGTTGGGSPGGTGGGTGGTTPTTVPNAPFALSSTSVTATGVTIVWYDNSNNESAFVVERATGVGPFAPIATLPVDSTTYTDGNLSASTGYTYRVKATNARGDSSYAGPLAVTTTAGSGTGGGDTGSSGTGTGGTGTGGSSGAGTGTGGVPNGPFNLNGYADGPTAASLAWHDNSDNETGFVVQRETGTSGTFVTVATLPANTVAYVDRTLAPGTQYTYHVRAVGGSGLSGPTGDVTVTTTATAGPTVGANDGSAFFPIAAFYQPAYNLPVSTARGLNTMLGYEASGDTQAAWTAAVNAYGLKYIREASADPTADVNDPNLLAWLNPVNEPDINDQTGSISAALYAQLHATPNAKPFVTSYSGGYMLGWQPGHDQAYYQTLMQYTDWIAPCIYPVSGWNLPDRIRAVGQLVDVGYQDAPGKRQLAYIEVGSQSLPWAGPDQRAPTPDEFRGEVWDAVIHGATGIVYFPETVSPFAYDNTDPAVALEMAVQNAKLTSYAGALLAPLNPAGLSATGSGNVEASVRQYKGKTYVFALNDSATAQDATIATTGLGAVATLAVDGEGRTVALQGGAITDHFKPFELHVYVTS